MRVGEREAMEVLTTHPLTRPLCDPEVVLDVELNLLARPGVGLHDIDTVLSYPVALAQCRRFFWERREIEAVTADAEPLAKGG